MACALALVQLSEPEWSPVGNSIFELKQLRRHSKTQTLSSTRRLSFLLGKAIASLLFVLVDCSHCEHHSSASCSRPLQASGRSFDRAVFPWVRHSTDTGTSLELAVPATPFTSRFSTTTAHATDPLDSDTHQLDFATLLNPAPSDLYQLATTTPQGNLRHPPSVGRWRRNLRHNSPWKKLRLLLFCAYVIHLLHYTPPLLENRLTFLFPSRHRQKMAVSTLRRTPPRTPSPVPM